MGKRAKSANPYCNCESFSIMAINSLFQIGTMHAPTRPRPATKKGRKAFWLKQLHMWHWMSSAISLIGLLLFAITGFTLNHAADIEASPVVAERAAQMPPALLASLGADPAGEIGRASCRERVCQYG